MGTISGSSHGVAKKLAGRTLAAPRDGFYNRRHQSLARRPLTAAPSVCFPGRRSLNRNDRGTASIVIGAMGMSKALSSIIFAAILTSAASADGREWTDSTGKFKVKGDLI